MNRVTHQLVAGPLVGLAVGIGDGVVGQAQFGDRHDNVRSVYRLGVLAAGAISLASGHWTDASIGAMTGVAALIGSRVVPAARGGGWQQFGMVEERRPPRDTGRGHEGTTSPQDEFGNPNAAPPASGAPGQGLPRNFEKQWRGHHG